MYNRLNSKLASEYLEINSIPLSRIIILNPYIISLQAYKDFRQETRQHSQFKIPPCGGADARYRMRSGYPTLKKCPPENRPLNENQNVPPIPNSTRKSQNEFPSQICIVVKLIDSGDVCKRFQRGLP